MTWDPDRGYDEGGQWSDEGRERYQRHYARTGKVNGRRKKPVIPAYSSDGED
jgi:hypothetical protein